MLIIRRLALVTFGLWGSWALALPQDRLQLPAELEDLTAQPSTVLTGQPLTEMLAAVDAQQSRFRLIRMEFEISTDLPLDLLPAEAVQDWKKDHGESARAEGRVCWAQSDSRRKVAVSWNVPSSVARLSMGRYLNRTVFTDGARDTTFFPGSRQALITPAGPLPVMPDPLVWLTPLGIRYQDALRSGTELRVLQFEGGAAILADVDGTQVRAWADPAFDFSVTAWQSSDGTACAVRYQRVDGIAVPESVVCRGADGSRLEMRAVHVALGQPAHAEVTPSLPPEVLVTDASKDPTKPEVYRVQPDGKWLRVANVIPGRRDVPPGVRWGTLGLAALAISAVATLRFLAISRK